MVVPLRIVKLIRSYCKKFSILIPFRCHSAGTLISLGADEIVMTKLAELTPVDPTSESHPFNPKIQNPTNPNQTQPLPVSVEDLRSYIAFAKEELKANRNQVVDLYSKLTNQQYGNPTHLHPLSLGNVYRVQKMIKIITNRLLDLHFTGHDGKKNSVISKIITEITEDICVHNYPIYSDEAERLGLNVIKPKDDQEKLIWKLYETYASTMKLSVPFNMLDEIGAQESYIGSYPAALVETIDAEDNFVYSFEIKKIIQQQAQIPGIPQMILPPLLNMNIAKSQWEQVR